MKNLGLTSRYALLGIFFAGFLSVWTGILPDNIAPGNEVNFLDLSDAHLTDEAAFWDPEPTQPCFTLSFSEEVHGTRVYRPDYFGNVRLETSKVLKEELREALLEEFTGQVWDEAKTCIEGGMVVSFSLNEDGRMGKTMLVHQLEGQMNLAGHAVLNVLTRMRRQGYVWRDGVGQAGEVSFGLSFRLDR